MIIHLHLNVILIVECLVILIIGKLLLTFILYFYPNENANIFSPNKRARESEQWPVGNWYYDTFLPVYKSIGFFVCFLYWNEYLWKSYVVLKGKRGIVGCPPSWRAKQQKHIAIPVCPNVFTTPYKGEWLCCECILCMKIHRMYEILFCFIKI